MKRMKIARTAALAVALGFVGLSATDYARHIAPTTAKAEDATANASSYEEDWLAYGARLHVGDSWIVETKNSERGVANARIGEMPTIRWKFTVEGIETFGNVDYYKVLVACDSQTVAKAPRLALWIEAETGKLASVKFELKVDDERALTLAKTFNGSRAVITPITAIPLDVLAFTASDFAAMKSVDAKTSSRERSVIRNKSIDEISYMKDVDDESAGLMEFGQDIEIEVERFDFTKTINGKDYNGLCKATLSNSTSRVEQLWAPNVPWPVESDNGVVHSTLVKYEAQRH